ncbi:hypothetical protein [Candidatus Palauibacter sp.]|uniref:hypothetical protein n=1 Tax=Candidatus Palauibacter sp. TaxID=3101350 RepID=UPI003B028714
MDKRLHKIELERSELLEKLLDLPDDESPDELKAAIRAVEQRRRAALREIEADDGADDDDGSATARHRLVSRARVSDVVGAALRGGGTVGGATRELQQDVGLDVDSIPLELLRGEQHRTAGQSSAPTNVPRTGPATIPAVFPASVTAWLGIPMPTVPAGEAIYRVMSTSATAAKVAGGAEASSSAAAYSTTTMKPGRIHARLHFRREDALTLASLEADLRRNLSSAVMSRLDAQVIAGASSEGLLTGALTSATADSGGQFTFDDAVGAATGALDGLYADVPGQLRMLVGVETGRRLLTLWRANETDMTTWAFLSGLLGGLRSSSHVPATATSGGRAKTQDLLIRRGMRMDAVCPVWQGVSILRDPYSAADEGEVAVHCTAFYAFKVLRSAGFVPGNLQVNA